MAREPTYGSTATHPPNWGSTRTEPDLQRHPYTNEAKERVRTWSTPSQAFTTYAAEYRTVVCCVAEVAVGILDQ